MFQFFTNSNELIDTNARFDEEHGHNEILKKSDFPAGHHIDARMSSNESLFTRHTDFRPISTGGNMSPDLMPAEHRTYPMMIKMIQGSIQNVDKWKQFYRSESIDHVKKPEFPTMASILADAFTENKTELDRKQRVTYETICGTFLLGLINDGIDNSTTLGAYFAKSLSGLSEKKSSSGDNLQHVIMQLRGLGAKEQLVMFLTGSAGAGKTTAVKLAQRFCFEFCKAVSILWDDRSFLFTAYTGSAASCFGGVTICKAAFLNRDNSLSQDDIDSWANVRILVIDEISFMKDSEMRKLDRQLKQCCGDRNKPFGGLSIIFAGDFRQLEPSLTEKNQLLFSGATFWENTLNAIIILESDHRFKDDPKYGRLLHRMWAGDLNRGDRLWLNERVVGSKQVPNLPDDFGERDACYACPTNKERNAISAGNFKRHVMKTCPDISSAALPPEHTVVIEADIRSTKQTNKNKKTHQTIGGSIRHRILTSCGDASVMTSSNKHVDPALCLYVGAHVICTIDNVDLNKEVPRGNGTLCRVVGLKLKDNCQSYRWKNFYNKKVWTVNAVDVESIELEHYPKSPGIQLLENELFDAQDKLENADLTSQENKNTRQNIAKLSESLRLLTARHRFTLNPQHYSTYVRVKAHAMAPETELRCRMTQLPINVNDATTGHKLQGMSKDIVIITSWPTGGLFKNWEYVVLSRVRTREGLYLFQPIDMDKSFSPSDELALFFQRAKKKQTAFLTERKKAKTEAKKWKTST